MKFKTFTVQKTTKTIHTAEIQAKSWEDAEEIALFTTVDWELKNGHTSVEITDEENDNE